MSVALPPYFPEQQLSATDKERVSWFYGRFVREFYGEYRLGHFILAGYASVPALLTPDLLYKIWQNFYGYQWGKGQLAIHRIAVTDLLLSPLCKEVGHELYEMHHEVRMAFQQWLQAAAASPEWQGRGLQTVETIAAFVQEYHEKPNPGTTRWGQGYQDVQDWGSTAYFDHNVVQRQIGHRLLAAVQAGKEAEAMRLMDIWAKTASQLQGLYANDPEKDLHQLARNVLVLDAWKALLQQGSQAFLDQLGTTSRDLKLLDDNPEGGIAIRVPTSTKQQTEEILTQTIWLFAVGIDEYKGGVSPLQGCANDMEAVSALLEQRTKIAGQIFRCKKLKNKKATYKAIQEGLHFFDSARNGDICVFYFAGHGEVTQIEGQRGRGLIAYDSRADSRAGNQALDISQWDIEGIIEPIILSKKVQVVCVYDTHEVASPELKQGLWERTLRAQPNELAGSLVVLNGCQIGQMSYETPAEKGQKPSGVFTHALAKLLAPGQPPLTYRQLIRDAEAIMKKSVTKAQTPFLEAFPERAADYYVGSGERDTSMVIPAQFENGQWVLVPPANIPLQPSLDFFHTLVRRRDHPERNFIVVEIGPSQLGLHGLEELAKNDLDITWDVNETYEFELVQVAPAKIKVAFDPAISEGIREYLGRTIEQELNYFGGSSHYCCLVPPQEAQFFVNNRGEQFQLRERAVSPTDDPFSWSGTLATGNSPEEFFQAIDHVARWEILARLGTPPQQYGLRVDFEKLEGIDFQSIAFIASGSTNTGEPIQINSEQATLLQYVQHADGRWLPPAVRFTLHSDAIPLNVQTLVFDTEFGIKTNIAQHLQPGEGIANKPNMNIQQSQTGQYQSNEVQGIAQLEPFTISDALNHNLGIRERRALLKIFVSAQAFDHSVLAQEPMTGPTTTARAPLAFRQPISPSNTTLTAQNGLACFTVPLLIRRDEVVPVQQTAGNMPPESAYEPIAETPASNAEPLTETPQSAYEPVTEEAPEANAEPATQNIADAHPQYELAKIGRKETPVRTQRNENSPPLRSLKAGTVVYILERGLEGWCRIGNLQESVRGFRELIRQDELGLVFSQIEDLGLPANYTEQFTLISAQYYQLRRDKELGLITEGEFGPKESRLVYSLLAFLEELNKVEEFVLESDLAVVR